MPGLLAVHAHPDDESIWTGGVTARYAAAAVPTAVVHCTDGFCADGSSFAPEGVRVAELTRALHILGAGPPRLLGYHDSGGDGRAGPGSFCAARFEDAVDRLITHIRELRPDVVLTYDPYGAYGHPDHVQAHRVALAAVEAAAIPQLGSGEPWSVDTVWLSTLPAPVVDELVAAGIMPYPFGTEPEAIDAVIDVRPWLDTKLAAIRAHQSEYERGATASIVDDPVARDLLATECYLRIDGPAARARRRSGGLQAGPRPVDDLFALD